jgi:uncharacterized protein YjbI with pentapeptide repeats
MGRILARRRQGLRKLSPDLISKARDETATQVTRLGLTFLGTVAFCLLSLLSPDAALLGGSEKINVPFAGPVSFSGFMVLGPLLLIALRVYLQVYVEHSTRLDRLARSVSAVRAPTLVPLDIPLVRLVSDLILYALLPVTMLLFAWKAAVFPYWGSGLFGVAVAVIVSHAALLFRTFSRSEVSLLFGVAVAGIVSRVSTSPWPSSVSAAIIAMVVTFGFGGLRRPFDLYRANLSGQNLRNYDLRSANLGSANLSGTDLDIAHLRGADLRGADLSGAHLAVANMRGAFLIQANLTGANLIEANLIGAYLSRATLTGAYLSEATLTGAYLTGATLTGAFLIQANLIGAHLISAKLSGAYLSEATLTGATLTGATLTGAFLVQANLIGANLLNANLSGANLSDANLSGANLLNANLSGANLHGTDLSSARDLKQTQLDKACGDARTTLGEGLTLKPCPQLP